MNYYHKIQSVYKRNPTQTRAPLVPIEFSCPEFEYLRKNLWVFTEQVDGITVRIDWDGPKKMTTISGPTIHDTLPEPLTERLLTGWDAKGESKEICLGDHFGFDTDSVTLYGEGYGAMIKEDGSNYRDDQDFVLFDVSVDGLWLERAGVEDIANSLRVDIVPVIGEGTLDDMIERCQAGFLSRWGNFQAEGIVARPSTELFTRSGHRIITKCKCRDFA